MHACMSIGEQKFFMADDFAEECGQKQANPMALGGTSVVIHRYVENCDQAVEQAQQAGATVIMPAMDMFWGDRYGIVRDPFGHEWSFATHIKDMSGEEMIEAAKNCMPPA